MKKYLSFSLLLIVIFIVSCTTVESDIENVISEPENNKREPELIEEETDDDEPEEFIEFYLEDEQITINLKGVPILNNYLQGTSNRQQSIEEMDLTRIYSDEESIYLLEFSCHDNLCSYIILNQNRDNPSFLIADLAKISETILSPDASKILLLFERDSGLSQGLKDIIVVDIMNWSRLQLANETTDDSTLDYQWPLKEAEWLDNETISIIKSNSDEPMDPSEGQDTGEKQVTNVILRIIKEEPVRQ